MQIEELTPNLAITFFVNVDGEQLILDSKILDVYPKRHIVLAEPIYHNKKIVTFRRKDITVSLLVNTGDDKPQLFTDVSVTLVKNGDSLCYNLATTTESKTYNRRQSFRCFVGIPTAFKCGPNKMAFIGMIRDVSITGFSVVCDEELPIGRNQMLHVTLKDLFEDTAEKFVFELLGLIVRIQTLENGKILYGCRLNNPLPGLEAYIVKKERQQLKKNSRTR